MEKQKSQLLGKIWNWIKIASLLFALIGSIYLLYSWWNRKQELTHLQSQLEQKEREIKQQAQQHYQEQKNYLELTANLANSPNIHSFFSNLLRKQAKMYADSQGIDISHYPLDFGGFYQGEQPEQRSLKSQYRKLGNCCFTPANKETIINLNQVYLLNKLGYEKYFATLEGYLEIGFANLLKTCSHELAHYIQFVKHGRSSCESDLGSDRYIEWLAKEHKEFSGEIYQIINKEYSELESKWKEIE